MPVNSSSWLRSPAARLTRTRSCSPSTACPTGTTVSTDPPYARFSAATSSSTLAKYAACNSHRSSPVSPYRPPHVEVAGEHAVVGHPRRLHGDPDIRVVRQGQLGEAVDLRVGVKVGDSVRTSTPPLRSARYSALTASGRGKKLVPSERGPEWRRAGSTVAAPDQCPSPYKIDV